MADWNATFDGECRALVERICSAGASRDSREQAWQALLVRVAPFIEEWAGGSALLRRCALTSEDEPRAVLVAVLSRLGDQDFANLRRFLARPRQVGPRTDALDKFLRLGEDQDPGGSDTPLRAWLLTLLRFAIRDHVRQRFGWSSTARASFELAGGAAEPPETVLAKLCGVLGARRDGTKLTVEYLPGALDADEIRRALEEAGWSAVPDAWPSSKRDVNTNAPPLEAAPEPTKRPPITDMMTVGRVVREMNDYVATFPDPMRRALELWLEDAGFDHISHELGGCGADKARALVRAAQARLRERFRGRWPELLGA